MFEYYSFRPAHLLRWSPGANLLLEGAAPYDTGWSEFAATPEGALLLGSALPVQRRPYLDWAVQYLEATGAAEPSFGCFGLHEWAMVYRDPNVRHSQVPLRLTREETDAVVESQPLRCTHFDAFRFFTPQAVPLNRFPLARATTVARDQPGCIHVAMDLYRFAYKLGPFCPSALLADAFDLARRAREVDMRASPYDLRKFGFEPIPIETRAGREEYVECQRDLSRHAQSVRDRLLIVHRGLQTESRVDPSSSTGL